MPTHHFWPMLSSSERWVRSQLVSALGSDITAADFETHSASWHKSCHLKYNNSKLARAKKRVISQVQDSERSRTMKRQALNISNCLFCEKGQEDGDLHLVSTFDADADANIRSTITELQDTQLLARIEGGKFDCKGCKIPLEMSGQFEKSLQNLHQEVSPRTR